MANKFLNGIELVGGFFRAVMTEPASPPAGQTVEWVDSSGIAWVKFSDGTKRTMTNVEPLIFGTRKDTNLTVAAGTQQVPITGGSFRILSVGARVSVQPTGASIIVDVNKNGTTVFGTQANRPTIAASTNNATVGALSVTDLVAGDYLTVDVDQIGSTVAGQNLVVVVRLIRTA